MHDGEHRRRAVLRRRRRLLLVLTCALVGVLAAVHLRANGRQEPRLLSLERAMLIDDALDRYAVDNGGVIPTKQQGLRALLEQPDEEPVPRNWSGPYLSDHSVIFDGWGHKFHYVSPGGGEPRRPYDLWSLGSDDRDGGIASAADLKFWEPKTLAK